MQLMLAELASQCAEGSVLLVEFDERFLASELPDPELWETRHYPPAFVARRIVGNNADLSPIERLEPSPSSTTSGPMDIVNLSDAQAFITKDGSEIRELLAHRNSCIRQQSLAEARLAPGITTAAHHHPRTEEIYFILEGTGRMHLGEAFREIGPGDAVAIPPGTMHWIANTGNETLRFLCCCAPGYENDDTVLRDS